jgi:asparagine synthase (glutamine-hydrolysing)
MCGIVGALSLGEQGLDSTFFLEMTRALKHRGPNDAGCLAVGSLAGENAARPHLLTEDAFSKEHPELPCLDREDGQALLQGGLWDVFLGHRRLSILDLSPRGHQPMASPSGRCWISYNGEVYNFRELRDALSREGQDFHTGTDTEVVLAAYEHWGESFVEHLNGMFALALWDSRERRLLLARDRYGIKPLYLYQDQDTLLFASEIKGILPYLKTKPEVDLLALDEYFAFQNILSDRTLFARVRILPPGKTLSAHLGGPVRAAKQYWDFEFRPFRERSEQEVQEELFEKIERAVERQCVSDVEIGSYLSGGLDSGTVATITARTRGRINTFTAGFEMTDAAPHELPFDERRQAERMAHFLETDHYQTVLGPDHMEAAMADLVWHLEDLRVGQCYPNFYAAHLASRFNRVVMSGMGGDELFGGYPWRYAAAIGDDHDHYIENYYRYWQRLVDGDAKPWLYTPDLGAEILSRSGGSFRDHCLSCFQAVFPHELRTQSIFDQVNYSLYFECKTFLHGLLIVEDRLSMAHSLETRVPLLDNELVEFACGIPIALKVNQLENIHPLDENMSRKKRRYQPNIKTGKNILRKTMQRFLPEEVTQGRKQGFSAPDESWFRGAAKGWVRDQLLGPEARNGDYLNRVFIQETLRQHVTGEKNKRLLIWSLLSFETLLRRFF